MIYRAGFVVEKIFLNKSMKKLIHNVHIYIYIYIYVYISSDVKLNSELKSNKKVIYLITKISVEEVEELRK